MDVYLLPAVVGGGIGDIDEVVCAGRHLARAGFPVVLYRKRGRPLPAGVDGRWDWPPHVRRSSLAPRAPRALTVAPAWGVTAAPGEAGPLGRPGPWAEEASEIELAYGADRTAHVSLEEFARTLTSRDETAERLREGGVRSREVPARLRRARRAGEVATFRRAYRRFRGLDRPNVLSLFATFRFDRAFAREFPEAVQVGPLWPGRGPRHGAVVRTVPRWVWYASPASAEAIAPEIVDGLAAARPAPELLVRSPRRWSTVRPSGRFVLHDGPLPDARWRRLFSQASMRVVTGSRSLLEALELGGPFLYFNGVLGPPTARRRHRPEKVVELLGLARAAGWPRDLLADLADFSRGRRVRDVVLRAATAEGGWSRFPPAPRPAGFVAGFEDAGRTLVRFAQALAESTGPVAPLIAEFRRRSHP